MAAEAEEPHPYRYGIAGGKGPLQRRRLAAQLSTADIAARLADAEGPPAARLGEVVELPVGVLVHRRYAGVADHVRLL